MGPERPRSQPLVLLHGFTGAPASWAGVRRRLPRSRTVLAPALLGHDGTAGPARVQSFTDELDRLADIVRAAGTPGARLCGYSMGGRVALGLLDRHPELFASAVLIGVHPGLADGQERTARRALDEERARLLDTGDLPTFVAAWEAQPLFATQGDLPAPTVARQRRIRLSHDPRGLARALRVLGPAAMPDYRPRLAGIRIPVRLVVGERDEKFLTIARAMTAALPRARLCVVEGAGHNVVMERPEAVARLLQEPDA
jgi:2-succinyl-6-hydroxy-2,4-cyclohexadiene-1-carboxylate synthase